MVKVRVKPARGHRGRVLSKNSRGDGLCKQLKTFYSDYLIDTAVPDTRVMRDMLFPKIEWHAYKPLPKVEE